LTQRVRGKKIQTSVKSVRFVAEISESERICGLQTFYPVVRQSVDDANGEREDDISVIDTGDMRELYFYILFL